MNTPSQFHRLDTWSDFSFGSGLWPQLNCLRDWSDLAGEGSACRPSHVVASGLRSFLAIAPRHPFLTTRASYSQPGCLQDVVARFSQSEQAKRNTEPKTAARHSPLYPHLRSDISSEICPVLCRNLSCGMCPALNCFIFCKSTVISSIGTEGEGVCFLFMHVNKPPSANMPESTNR